MIEAKISEDDGTARDEITRSQRLALLSREWEEGGKGGFQVFACVDGRAFNREADVAKMLRATEGKVFTLKTLPQIVECSQLRNFRTTTGPS